MLRAHIERSLRQSTMRSRSNSATRSSSTNINRSSVLGPNVGRKPHLPRLPVPDLRQTLNKYLASLEPFLLEDETRGGMPYHSAYALRVKWADEFEAGIGNVLQERLLALDRASPNNWLDDNFWINKAYLEWRAPLLVNSNWWLAFFDDELIPKGALAGETSNNRAGTTFWQVRRAAWLVHRVLDWKWQLETQELHPDTTRTGIWLRNSTSKMFNIARIPEPFCDVVSQAPPPSQRSARSILLMVHNWCYAVAVYHPPSSPSSPPILLTPKEIEARIRAVVVDVESRLANGETAVPVGVLSADDRDRWAENLSYLLSLSPTNKKSHQAMLHSVIGLSLDHTSYTISPGPSSPTRQLSLDAHLHTIRGTSLNAANRFYDKAFSLIVDPSTHAGAMGEHSPLDALVPSIIAEYGIVQGVDVDAFKGDIAAPEAGVPMLKEESMDRGWERLDWVADEKMRKECVAAEQRARKIIADSDDSVLWFEDYGTDWIKNTARLSPDAYIQMVLQLAWYRTRNEFTATYETVLTRMFKNGRTETVRTLTRDSRDWVLSMVDPNISQLTRHRALQRAINSHARLTREAATGRGIDRHLLGLRLLLRPLNGERVALFDDELFERSTQWKLCTSGLSAGHLFKGTGYGSIYEDGYGINYMAAPEMIKFGIESKFSSPDTSTERFKQAILGALADVQTVCVTQEETNSHFISSHL